MSDLAAAAAALGIPEVLAQRSAEARAAETGTSIEEILAAWAGGGSAPVSANAPDLGAEEPPDAQVETTPADETPQVTIEIPTTVSETPVPVTATAVTRAPMPSQVTMAEAANLPVVVTVPTTGIKERTNFVVPRWLAYLFLFIPLVALFALGGAATGECGSANELATNVITGDIVNCDGSPFEGSSTGGGTTDFIALGQAIYNGQEIGAVNCSACHGAGGGGGVGPALNGVVTTFGACPDQEEWVGLGSAGFKAAGRNTYGDTGKPVTQGMPGFNSSLSPEQLASVTAFERVRFGGEDQDTALIDCGLVEETPDGGVGTDGEPPVDGEAPVEGEPDSTTTTVPEA